MNGNKSPTPAELTIVVAGGVMLIASFLDFTGPQSTWDSFVFPVATLLPVYGALMALQIVLTIAKVRLPRRVLGFTWEQLQLLLGLFAGVMAVGWLVSDVTEKGIGFWLEVAGGIALAVGAIRLQRERHTGAIG